MSHLIKKKISGMTKSSPSTDKNRIKIHYLHHLLEEEMEREVKLVSQMHACHWVLYNLPKEGHIAIGSKISFIYQALLISNMAMALKDESEPREWSADTDWEAVFWRVNFLVSTCNTIIPYQKVQVIGSNRQPE